MMRHKSSVIRWALLAAPLALLQTAFDVSPARGQAGVILTGLGESAQNIDVTESGGNPTALVSITCCDPMGMPVVPMHGTEGEAVTNLINDLVIFDGTPPNFTKWNDLQGDLFMIPVEIQLDQPRAVNFYTLTSANDAPDRDPWEWRFLGTNVANPTPADFVLLDERTGVEFPARHQTQLFGPLGNTTEYTTYRFEFETQWVASMTGPAPGGAFDSIQLAEVELFEDFAGGGAKLTINRGSNTLPTTMSLTNAGTSPMNVIGYSITSAAETLNSNNWTSIADNSDGDDGGESDSDNWIRLTEPNGRGDLSEVEEPNGTGGFVINPGSSFDLGSNVWIKHPTEDVLVEILLADGTTQSVSVSYTGGVAYKFGDLNFDRGASLTFADWIAFKSGHGFNFSTVFSPAESYAKGDLDGDFDNDLDDFIVFKQTFDAANGAGAFQAMLAAVPEPSAAVLLGVAAFIGLFPVARRRGKLFLLVGLMSLVLGGETAQAQVILPGLVGGDLTNPDDAGPAEAFATAGADSPVNEAPPLALDNAVNTKWLSFDPDGTTFDIRFHRNARSAVNQYTLTSANDFPERDPYSWIVSGSNDGTNFTVVDTKSAQDFTARLQTQQFTFTNATPYNIYRFDFMTSQGAGVPTDPAPNSIQLAEIELFGTPLVPVLLTLEVNPTTGQITMANNNTFSDAALAIDSYSIRSPSGSLNFQNWSNNLATPGTLDGQSLQDQNLAGFPRGNGTGNGWEESAGSSNHELREWYLGTGGVGTSTLDIGDEIVMNNVFQIGGQQDLIFEYTSNGEKLQGIVEYVGVVDVEGDYNGNGVVDAADYTVWRDTLGSTTNLAADGDDDNAVDQGDYTFWKTRFGNTSGSGAGIAAAAVPEPASCFLGLVAAGLVLAIRKRAVQQQSLVGAACVTMACFVLANGALASTLDRNYQFGDDAQENAVVGQVVGTSSVVPGHTLDSASQGSFFDIMQQGGPTYVNTQSTARPGARASERGIQFTGSSSQHLSGAGFGSPREGGALANPQILNYPNSRIMQVWARPTLDTGARQDVVSDTFQFGIHITAGDTWGHTYGAAVGDDAIGDDYDTGAPVAYNQWTHIMQRTFDNDGVAVYVNGVAVSRFNATYFEQTQAADNRNLYVGAASGGTANFFTGQLDSLKLMVAGVFIPQPPNQPIPVDWGAFNIATENEYIPAALAGMGFVNGDVNGDGVVNGNGAGPAATDDVRFFIDHWLDERRVNDFVIGDLVSRTQQGDLNFDGRTTLADWSILRSAHASGANLDLAALLGGGTVPEPSALALFGLAMASISGLGRRRRR